MQIQMPIDLEEKSGRYTAPKYGGGTEQVLWRTINGARVAIRAGRIVSGPKGLVGRAYRPHSSPPAGNTRGSVGAGGATRKPSKNLMRRQGTARREAAAAQQEGRAGRMMARKGVKTLKVTDAEAKQIGRVERLAKDVEKRNKKMDGPTDLADLRKSVMRGNMGIKRQKMPQLDGDVPRNFVNAMKERGVKVETKKMKVSDLKATQREVDATKTVGMATAQARGDINLKRGARIIVSREGFILDGHHRWSSLRTLDPNNTMDVWQVDLPMADILKATQGFPGVTYRGMGK